MAYAERTTVSVARSRDEIEKLLERHGATAFAYMQRGNQHLLAFEMRDRHIRFTLPVPAEETFRSKRRTVLQAKAAYDQEARRRWRALALIIKAKLEAVESGIVTLDEEFLAQTVAAQGQTVFEHLQPQLERMYHNGEVPLLLPGPRAS